MKKNLLKNNGVQSLIASLVCIVLGLFIGYIVLLFINPTGAGNAIVTIVKNFMTYNRPQAQLKYMGNTLVKTAPLLLCSLSILFSYKVGLFNIGAPVSTVQAWLWRFTRRLAWAGAGSPASYSQCWQARCSAA